MTRLFKQNKSVMNVQFLNILLNLMRLKTRLKIAFVFLLALLLSGCGWFRDRSRDYVEAECIPTIQVCPGIETQPFSHEYDIPGT